MRMRISIPANSDHAPQSGFTLVELMVVVAIIGFVSAAVVLAMPDPRGRVIDDADRFAARVAAARDEAVITARPMRSEEHTSELQSLMRISYAVFCLKEKK